MGRRKDVFSLRSTVYGVERQYARALEKIEHEFQFEKDRVQIRRFFNLKEIEGFSVNRILKYWHSLKVFNSVSSSGLADARREDIEAYLLLLRRKYKVSGQETMWYCVKKYFEWVGKLELFDGLKPSFKGKGMKLPEELLTVDEINAMIKDAKCLRDKALIAILYESGCRIGEIVTLQMKHVQFDQYGAVLIVNGKTGMRRVRLIDSAQVFAEHVSSLPDNPDCCIWRNSSGNVFTYQAIAKMLKTTAVRVGIKKNVYPHLFRHTRATHLADKLTEAQMKILFGWVGNSDVPSVYVHLSGRDVEEALLRMHGIEISQKPVFAKKVGPCVF